MKAGKNTYITMVSSSLIISLLALAGCNKAQDTKAADPVATAPTTPPAPAAPAYTPPTAEQLTQLVAPVALFPDKLLAQVLAGAQYPEQITAADQWITQNQTQSPALSGTALQDAANQQPWDVSVKSLSAFPAVLRQMAGNIAWTTALGSAYAHAPNDVMNAVQTMRLRAQQAGNLKNSKQLKITSSPRLAPPPEYIDDDRYYAVAPPAQTIVIESARPDVVYVPDYNPALAYGAPVPVYPSYSYHPAYGGNFIAGSIISFGVGIIVGSALAHHADGGWHSWGMNWGGHGYDPHYNRPWTRPAVTYNNTVYAPRSSITINRNYETRITTNHFAPANQPPLNGNAHQGDNRPPPAYGQQAHPGAHAPMTMPHFSAADQRPGAHPMPPSGIGAPLHSGQASATPGAPTHTRANERKPDTRPRSETGERLNSGGMHERSSGTTLSTSGRSQPVPERPAPASNSLRSADVQRSGIHQGRDARDTREVREMRDTGERRENFRQQSAPQVPASRPAPPAQHMYPAPPQHMQMPHPPEPRVQSPRPPQHVQERVQQERPQQHQERPRPASRQDEHRENR